MCARHGKNIVKCNRLTQRTTNEYLLVVARHRYLDPTRLPVCRRSPEEERPGTGGRCPRNVMVICQSGTDGEGEGGRERASLAKVRSGGNARNQRNRWSDPTFPPRGTRTATPLPGAWVPISAQCCLRPFVAPGYRALSLQVYPLQTRAPHLALYRTTLRFRLRHTE